MKTNIFLQARINSTRLPKKVIKKICGKPIIELIIERMKSVNDIEQIVLVTGSSSLNYELIEIVKKLGIDYFCGSEENVLDRFYNANLKFRSDNLIRITCDNPLIDPEIINECLKKFLNENYDLLYLDDNSGFPKGLNFEIFSHTALKNTWEQQSEKFIDDTEFKKTFLSPGLLLKNSKLRKIPFVNKNGYSDLRLTIDSEDDFSLIKKIYEELYPQKNIFTLIDVLNLLSQKPDLIKINEKHPSNSKDNNIN